MDLWVENGWHIVAPVNYEANHVLIGNLPGTVGNLHLLSHPEASIRVLITISMGVHID